MQKIILFSATLGALLLSTACTVVSPDPGHTAVLVRKPLFFGHGGIESEPVSTGRSYAAFSTESYDVNMQPIQEEVKFDDLMSSDGVPLDFDAVIRYRYTDPVDLVRRFGPPEVESDRQPVNRFYLVNIDREFRNRVRQAVRKHGMNETAIQTTAIEAIDTEVTQGMNAYIDAAKLPIQLMQITVGKANPPDSIKNQRIETAAQEQRIQTEGQKKLAEDARMNAESSRAKADNAYRNAMDLNPEQFLRLETIKMQRDVCGSGHCTFILNGSGAGTIINTGK